MEKEYIIRGYSPKKLFNLFEDISKIPRGSGNESRIADFIVEFAIKKNLYYYRDKFNNVYVRKTASSKYKNYPPILMQAHIDMVCEKNSGTVHDFNSDPLDLYITEEGLLKARGTTLGSDDGAGVALMLALLETDSSFNDFSFSDTAIVPDNVKKIDENIELPEIECLFTSNEETGMDGALNFDYSEIKSKILINLDSEGEGIAWAGCAGGLQNKIILPTDDIPFYGHCLKIKVFGLSGGHSGIDIDKNLENACNIMGRILSDLYNKSPFNLISLTCEGKINVIARECEAVIAVVEKNESKDLLLAFEKIIYNELSEADKNFKIHISQVSSPNSMLTFKSTYRVISILSLAPSGVLCFSREMEGLVSASCNLGKISTYEDYIEFHYMGRSQDENLMDWINTKFNWLAKLCEAENLCLARYPGWQYKKSSRLQKVYTDTWQELYGGVAEIKAVHAGLECGIIIDKSKGYSDITDAISIGPRMRYIHTPNEELDLKSYERFYKLVYKLIINLSEFN